MSNMTGRMPTKGFLDNVKVKNSSGQDISSILSTYELSDFDTSTENIIYMGKLDKNGSWVISKINTLDGTKRYKNGISDYSTNWNNRALISYETFDNAF